MAGLVFTGAIISFSRGRATKPSPPVTVSEV